MKQSAIRIALLLCCLILFSANAQLRKASDYFPLQVGNIWQYKPDPDFYTDRHIEIISDSLIGDTLWAYRVLGRALDEPSVPDAYGYYHYNNDSTIVYRCFEEPFIPFGGFPMIDTRGGLDTTWRYPLGDITGFFAITDTGTGIFFDQSRHWAEVNLVDPFQDTLKVVEGETMVFVERIGPVQIAKEFLVYAKINGIEYGTPLTSVNSRDNPGVPTESALQIYPNPIHGKTTIIVNMTSLQSVEITVVSLLGRTIRTIFDGTLPIGAQRVSWDGKDNQGERVAEGIYFVVLKSNESITSQKLIHLIH